MDTFVSGSIEDLDNELTLCDPTNSHPTLIQGLRDCLIGYKSGYLSVIIRKSDEQVVYDIALRVRI